MNATKDKNAHVSVPYPTSRPPRWPWGIACAASVAASAVVFRFYNTVEAIDSSLLLFVAAVILGCVAVWPEAAVWTWRTVSAVVVSLKSVGAAGITKSRSAGLPRMRSDADHGIGPLLLIPRFFTILIGLWTPWYHVTLAFQLPALPSLIWFYVTFALSIVCFLVLKRPEVSLRRVDIGLCFAVGGLGVLCGLLTAVIRCPNDDDFSYYHRILYQMMYVNHPFFLTHMGDNATGLPTLSVVETATSVEPIAGLTAHLLRIDPLWAYQNGIGIISGFILPVIYFSLYRKFRLRPSIAVAATLMAMLFLVIDGGCIRSFGNVSFNRIWQGKALLWTVALPLIALYALDYVTRPTRWRFALLALACIAAPGLSNSGIYLPQVLLVGIAIAYLLRSPAEPSTRLRTAIWLLASTAYADVYALGLLSGFIPEPKDMRIYMDPHTWPQDWSGSLGLVISSHRILARDLAIVMLLPAVCLKKHLRSLALIYSAAIVILALNPISGAFWIKHTLAANYWRMLYLMPLPWSAGLIANCLPRLDAGVARSTLKVAVALVVLVLCKAAFVDVSIPPGNSASFKQIGEPKLRADDEEFVHATSRYLHGHTLLAPEPVAVTAGLLDPTIQLECGRGFETYQVFVLASRESEGMRRQMAQRSVTDSRDNPQYQKDFVGAIQDGVDRVVARDGAATRVLTYLQRTGVKWKCVYHGEGLSLFVPEGGH